MQCTLESILREALKKTLNVWLFTLFDKYIFKKKSLRFGKYLVIDVCHEKAKKKAFFRVFYVFFNIRVLRVTIILSSNFFHVWLSYNILHY